MNDDTSNNDEVSQPWSHRRQEIGVIVWASFLTACLATMVFFAFFDPMMFANDEMSFTWLQDRMTSYAVGFFFFWSVTLVSALLTAYLIDTLPSDNDKNNSAKERVAGRKP